MPNLPPDIQEILKRAENRSCADCQARDPKWASVSIGIIICETCAGIHRNLGTHLSTVKSTSLDRWKPEWVTTVKAIGNARANAFYEHSVPQEERYAAGTSVSQGDKLDPQEGRKLERWIRNKYELRKYALPGVDEPRERLKRGESLDDASPGGGTEKHEKKEKKEKHKSRRKAEEAAAATRGFSEAFASLGEWATTEADAEGKAASEDKEGKAKKKKKEKRDGSRKHRHSSASQPPEAGRFGAAGPEAVGAQDVVGVPGEEALSPVPVSPGGGWGGDSWSYGGGPPGCGGQWGPGGALPGQPLQQPVVSPTAYGAAPAAALASAPPYAGPAAQQAAAVGERRRALMSVARLFQAPESLGLAPGVGASLLPLHGFDLQAAEFHPTALRRPRDAQQGSFAEASESDAPGKPRADSSKSRADSEVSQVQDELRKIRSEMRHLREDVCREIKEETISVLRSQEGGRSRGVSAATQALEDDAEDWWARGGGTNGSPQMPAPMPQGIPGQWTGVPNGALSTVGAAADLGLMAGAGSQAADPTSPNPSMLPPADVSGPDLAWMAGDSPGNPSSAGHYQPQVTGCTDAGPREAPQPSSFGYVDREAFANYAHHFRQLDENQDNLVEGRDVRRLFDQSMLDPSELKLIWAVCDTSRTGRLTLEEFACAMHIVSCRRQGAELPLALPPELSNTVQHLAAEYRATAPPPAAPPPGASNQAPEANGVAEADGFGQSSPWEPAAEELERYSSTFASIDVDGVGSIGPLEAKELLEKTSLPTEELSQIWQMSDVDLDSRLSPGELICAMHLATRRMQGLALPESLPPELLAFALGGPEAATKGEAPAPGGPPADGASPRLLPPEGEEMAWQGVLTEEELAEIWHLSDADGDGRLAYNDFVYAALILASRKRGLELPADIGRKEAFEVLEQSKLPAEELSRIWQMADADGDGQLSFGDFALALHLAGRRLRGLELPTSPPAAAAVVPPPPPPAAGMPPASASSMGPSLMGDLGSPWAITPERVRRYCALFDGLPRQDPEALRQDEVRETLERSGLPREDLARIWQLADADVDGMLTFGEFACALHLVAGRRQGLELPPALPPELAQLAQLAEVLGSSAGGGGGASASSSGIPWAVLPDQLDRYRDFFEGLEKSATGAVGPQEAVDFMARSQLPQEELLHALRLSDMDGDGQLSFEEFACAMHLVTLRCQGLELPVELPDDLVASLPGSWAVSDEQLRSYRGLFHEAAGRPGADALGPDEAWEVLERSDLPRDELGRILRLADADGDGRLTPGEFACAMHLTARCRQGAAVPAELPSELLGVEARMASVS